MKIHIITLSFIKFNYLLNLIYYLLNTLKSILFTLKLNNSIVFDLHFTFFDLHMKIKNNKM